MARPRRKSEQQASVTVADIEADLNTGDIVLLPGSDAEYLANVRGTWCGFSRCAFLVRTGPGMEGLLLCHADARAGDDEGAIPVVTLAPLAEEIAAVGCTYIIVRRLARPLRSAERRHVREFASASVGLSLHPHANILMASSSRATRPTCLPALFGPKIERFFCSELVAQMLVHAGQVQLKRNLDFLPSSRTHGHVLQAPVAAACSSQGLALAEKLITLSVNMSPTKYSVDPIHE